MKALRDADDAALAAYAAFVAARVLEAVLEVVTGADRAEGAGRDLPGWRLIERPAARDGADDMPRRLIVTPDGRHASAEPAGDPRPRVSRRARRAP